MQFQMVNTCLCMYIKCIIDRVINTRDYVVTEQRLVIFTRCLEKEIKSLSAFEAMQLNIKE